MKKLLLAIAALVLLIPAAEAGKKGQKTAPKKKHKPTYYVNGDGTYSTGKPDAKRSTPYKGDKVPENDGQKKNLQRNMNYGTGQELAPSNGNR